MSKELIKQVRGLEDRFSQIIKETNCGLNFTQESAFAIQAIMDNKLLMGAEAMSLKKAVLNVALTGLTLNPKLQYCYLVPRKMKGQMMCCLDISYKGMIKILTDSGAVKSIFTDLVYENDSFDLEFGLTPRLKHVPLIVGERGALVGAYSVATLSDGGKDFIFMRRDELDKVKASSMYSGSGSIWDSWEGEMYKKTVIKRHYKTLPKSASADKIADVIEIDNNNMGFEAKESKNFDDIFDTEIIEEEPNEEPKKKASEKVNVDKDGQTTLV